MDRILRNISFYRWDLEKEFVEIEEGQVEWLEGIVRKNGVIKFKGLY